MDDMTYSETLPAVRVTPAMKAAVEMIAAHSVSQRLSDHIRLALQLYIEQRLGGRGVGRGQASPLNPVHEKP